MLLRDLMDGDIEAFTVDYDPNGSLVTTHESQGTDMGLYGGLLGWQAHDERLENYQQGIREAGIHIQVNYLSYGAEHPNTYRMTIANAETSHTMTAISTGGGMIEVQKNRRRRRLHRRRFSRTADLRARPASAGHQPAAQPYV
ncbi:MAG: hypothetical protein M5U34_43765 [Chloroflexi bacterium]|nr:hypothetical protein [Chloroflexota bacterium]